MTDGEVVAALVDRSVVALTLWGEARREPIEGLVAVACVIRNRVRTQYRGTTYREVCLAPWQFSCWRKEGGAANHAAVLTLAQQLVSGQLIEDRAFHECAWVTDGVMADLLRDRVGTARHYHAARMHPRPKWAVGKTPAFHVGGHLFFERIL